MHFATVSSVQADVKDLGLLLPVYNRLWLRTKDEWYSEQASVIRELLAREQAIVGKLSWAERVLQPNKQVGMYGTAR